MSEVEEIMAVQSKTAKDALAKINARYFTQGKLKDENQRSSLLNEYYAVLDSYLSGIEIADGRIPDFFTQQFGARKTQIVSEAKRAILKALTTAPPRGLPPIPGTTAMQHVTETLEGEMLSAATYYDERLNAILSHAKLSEDGIPLYLYIASISEGSCGLCVASNIKVYEETDIGFELPRHPNCQCVLVPFDEEADLKYSSRSSSVSNRDDDNSNNRKGIDVDTVLDVVQTLLDVAGLIPVVGEIFDGANALISLGRGNYVDAALSVASMVPVVGWAGTGAKLIHKGAKYVDEAAAVAVKVGREVAQHADEAVEVIAKVGKKTVPTISQRITKSRVEAVMRRAMPSRTFIGGKPAEEILLKTFGGVTQQQYKTAITYRYVDQFSKKVIRESKVGYKAWSSTIEKQIKKDGMIIYQKGLKAEWHFFRSGMTGMVGADKRLLDLLDESGIKYYIYD